MRVTILEKVWRLSFVKKLRTTTMEGECDGPHVKGKTIRISERLRGRKFLETILHEMLHAADWHKDEYWVQEVAKDLSRVLMRQEIRDRIFPKQ